MKIQRLGSRTVVARSVMDYLYQNPIIDAEKLGEVADVSLPSAYKLLNDLEKMEILKKTTGGQRGRSYVFEDYLGLFR